MDGVRKYFTTMNIALMAVAIALNIAIGSIVYNAKLPLYLDSIGTVLVGVLAGPWVGAATGLLASLIWGFLGNPAYAAFAGVAAVIGALAGAFGRAGWVKVWWRAALAGLITGVVSALISAPIAAYVFGGVTGSGTDVLVAAFRAAGLDALMSNVAQGSMSDPLDKAVTFLIVWALLLALPARFKARFSAAPGATRRARPSSSRRRRARR